MKKKIISKYVDGVNKKIHKQHYIGLGIFIFLFAIVSIFFITRGVTPFSSELAYIEHSILGKDAGSVVPASCNSAPPTSHVLNDCTTTCWNGTTYDPYLSPESCPAPRNCTSASGVTYPHGESSIAYQTSVVPFGSTCISEVRQCWDGTISGSYTNPSCTVTPPANCLGTPWGTVNHNTSRTGYSASAVNSPTSCDSVSQTRNCWDGTLSGTYTITSCVVKSGSITVPASCVIAALASTCSVTASWTSDNLDSPRFYNNNTGSTLSTDASGSQSVIVAHGGTTFNLTDSTSHTYDSETVSASCAAGTTWNTSTGRCEYDTTVSLSINPTIVSRNDDATLTWTSTYATNCNTSGNWTTSGVFNGNKSTGSLTSNQTYTLQCTGLGAPSPTVSASVVVGTAENPILNKDDVTFQPFPTSVTTFTGQYTPNGKFVVVGDPTTTDSCKVTRNGVTIATGGSNLTVKFSDYGSVQGTYAASCSYTDGNGTVWNSTPFTIWYQPVPPPPVVSLKASPTTVSAGSPTVLTWTVTYPGSVQVPARTCTLAATTVCSGGHGNCNASQLASEVSVNAIIQASSTDVNDPTGVRKITTTALNIVPGYDMTANDGDTDWKSSGKKTFMLDKSTDFMLNCGAEDDASQGVRVLVTNSVEG